MYNQKQAKKFGRPDWAQINELKANASGALDRLRQAFNTFANTKISLKQILAHLEFEDPDFYYALSVPGSVLNGDMRQVGKRGKAVDESYLISQWTGGWDGGIFKDAENVQESAAVWAMSLAERRARLSEWQDVIVKEQVEHLYDLGKIFNDYQNKLNRKFGENEEQTVISKRIIGCTTTAAAKYSEYLRSALPEVVLVEEAGEILESHVLTALGEETRRLILIGDHKYVYHCSSEYFSNSISDSSVQKSTTMRLPWRRVTATT